MNVDPLSSRAPAVRLDKKFLSHTCPIDPADYAVYWGVDYSIKKKGGGGYFCRHLLRLLSVLAPVQSGLVFALLICNFITRSLFALWQPLSGVPVLKTKLKLNLCCSQQKVSMMFPLFWNFIFPKLVFVKPPKTRSQCPQEEQQKPETTSS